MSNAMSKTLFCIKEMKAMCKGIAPSYVVKKVRTICKNQKLHLTLQNQWLVKVEIVKSIDNCKGYFLSRSKFLSHIPSDLIFQAVYLQDLFFRRYAFRSYFLGHMLSGFVFQAVRYYFLIALSSIYRWIIPSNFKLYLQIDYAIKFCKNLGTMWRNTIEFKAYLHPSRGFKICSNN